MARPADAVRPAVAPDRPGRLRADRRGLALVGPDRQRLGLAGHGGVRRAGPRRRLRTAVAAGALTLSYGLAWDATVEQYDSDRVLGQLGGEALWLAAVLAAALAYRSTRRWQDEVAARSAQSLHEQEVEALRRRAEERVGIARDLHDVVSHTLVVVGVHLNVALDAFDEEPEEARGALRLAQDVRGPAFLTEEIDPDGLRHAVRVVAAGEALLSPSVTRRVIKQFARRPVRRGWPR